MVQLDNIIASSDVSGFIMFIKANTIPDTKIFFHIYISLIKSELNQDIYIHFLNEMIINKFDISKVQHIKKMITVLNMNKHNIAYQYTLLCLIHSELVNRLAKFTDNISNGTVGNNYKNDKNVCNMVNNIVSYINSFTGRFYIKFKSYNTDELSLTTTKYNAKYIDDLWVIDNRLELINRLILLVEYFDTSVLAHINIDLVSYNDILEYEYDRLCKYYSDAIKKLQNYFIKLQKIIVVNDNVIQLMTKILNEKVQVDVDKYTFIIRNEATLTDNGINQSDADKE